MINRQMQQFSLYVNEPITDNFGHKKDNFIFLEYIYVAINFISINKISNDIRYKDCEYTGLTKYKGLDITKKYKIKNDTFDFSIESFNEFTPYSQYILKRVI